MKKKAISFQGKKHYFREKISTLGKKNLIATFTLPIAVLSVHPSWKSQPFCGPSLRSGQQQASFSKAGEQKNSKNSDKGLQLKIFPQEKIGKT